MASPIPFRPRIGKTDRSLYRGVTGYAKRHGLTVSRLDTSRSLVGQGIGEDAAEFGAQPDIERRRRLAKSLQNRTSESSRQRLLNRILANYGQTTGSSGTRVNPRRF